MHYTIFEPPLPTFREFCRLISLVLCDVHIDSGVLAFLISCSPHLEQLTIERCNVNHLEIVASNLKSFRFKGLLESVGVINVPVLEIVFMDLGFPLTMRLFTQRIRVELIGFLHSVSAVENLHLDCFYVQSLATRNLGTHFINLQVLELSNISFEHNEVFGMLTLIGNCPNLWKVTITVCSRDDRTAIECGARAHKFQFQWDERDEDCYRNWFKGGNAIHQLCTGQFTTATENDSCPQNKPCSDLSP